jgi:hypothetical protein
MDQMEANIMKGKLESSGITCLIDPGLSYANPLLTNASGWIKINVREQDAKAAKEVLEIE